MCVGELTEYAINGLLSALSMKLHKTITRNWHSGEGERAGGAESVV